MYAGRHARTHSAAGTQYWQERRQTQIETGNASQILQQKAAVAYEANTDKTQQTKKFVELNLVLSDEPHMGKSTRMQVPWPIYLTDVDNVRADHKWPGTTSWRG